MKNSAFIKLDGEEDNAYVDIYTSYGVSFIKGAYINLVKKAASKGYVENSSRLAHGVQMLASPKYARYSSKQVSVNILLEADSLQQYVTRIEDFTDKISQGLFCLKIPSLHRIFKLVYNDIKIKQEFRNNRAIFTLEMIEPNTEERIAI